MKKWKGSDDMDFTKLNVEFANMQTTIFKYNKIVNLIETRIKNNSKSINKCESKNKKLNNIEKELDVLYVNLLKHENDFLNSLINDNKTSTKGDK